MPVKATTYQQFLEQVSGSPSLSFTDEKDIILQRFRPPERPVARFAPVTFLLDYATRKYMYVEETCFDLLGYTAAYFLETGLDEYISKWHPGDFKVVNEKVFPENFLFLDSIPPIRYGDYIFSHNYRVLNAKGEYTNLVQRYSFFYNHRTGKPTGIIGIVVDITHFKNDQSIVHTIEEYTEMNGNAYNKLLVKKVYPVFDGPLPQRISKRELEVLRQMAEGLSSKRIAGNLGLSIHTVNNHRKSMLQKTGCRSAGELMKYVMEHGLL